MSLLNDLTCKDHEEADTRLMAHMNYCASNLGSKKVVIYANDTDIIMLSMYHYCHIENLEVWIEKSGTFIPIHQIVSMFAEKYNINPQLFTSTLLCAYALSDCDSNSYPFRRGKRRAVKVLIQELHNLPYLTNFATGDKEISDGVKSDARRFFGALYGSNSNVDLNEL